MDKNTIEEKEQGIKQRLGILLVLLIGLIIIGGAYAFFTAVFTGVEEDPTISIGAGRLGLHMDGGNDIVMNNIYPRVEAWETKRFTITGNNDTPLHMEYELSLIVTENTFSTNALTYTLESQNTTNDGIPMSAITTQRGIPTGPGVHTLGQGFFDEPGNDMVHTYYLTFFFPSRGVAQNEDMGRSFRAHVGVGEATNHTLRSAILADNQVRTDADFTQVIVDQETWDNAYSYDWECSWMQEWDPAYECDQIVYNREGMSLQSGLFQTNDEHGNAFFFRGSHQGVNNNVIFAGHQWKILRIEGNGNIRMIYNGECPNNQCTINGNNAGENATIGNSAFNTQINHNRFVGYMFGSETGSFNEQHANTHNSTIKNFINNWFEANITGEHLDMVASNTRFCNDRSLTVAYNNATSGLGLNAAHWGFLGRQTAPSLACPRDEDRLELPIALPTADELIMAGAGVWNHESVFFLGTEVNFWTMTPFLTMTGSDATGARTWPMPTIEFGAENMGIMGHSSELSAAVRPVISLNANTPVIRGNGSATDPFIVTE